MDDAPGIHAELESDERGARVRELVARLEPNRRLALFLREVEDMSYEEIAEATNVPVGTVRSRIARGRRQLAQILGNHDRATERQNPDHA